MLTYLAAALPRFSSPAARLLALQCALRADHHGQVRLPHGFLRGMRLHGRGELWHELEHAGWLHRPRRRCSPIAGTAARRRRPPPGPRTHARASAPPNGPCTPPLWPSPAALPSALRLAALVLAAHSTAGVGGGELETLTRQCGQPPQQLEDLLDQLVRARLVTAWHHQHDSDEVRWELPTHSPPSEGVTQEARG